MVAGSGCVRTTNSVTSARLAPAPRIPWTNVRTFRVSRGPPLEAYPKKVCVLLLVGSTDGPVCRNGLYLDDMVETRSPHPRHGTQSPLSRPASLVSIEELRFERG
jgi:hypothetical protein